MGFIRYYILWNNILSLFCTVLISLNHVQQQIQCKNNANKQIMQYLLLKTFINNLFLITKNKTETSIEKEIHNGSNDSYNYQWNSDKIVDNSISIIQHPTKHYFNKTDREIKYRLENRKNIFQEILV